MAVLVTGASGFVGSVLVPLLLEQGHKVYALSRHPPIGSAKLVPLVGDVTEENLGLYSVPQNIDAVYHLAGIIRLGKDKDGSIFQTNVEGTKNVISLCVKRGIRHLYHMSTAYTYEYHNDYGRSKAQAEMLVLESDIPDVTVFKPAIIMGTEDAPFPGHFVQFASGIVRVHRRADAIRRKIEGEMRLPILEPAFRVRGNPKGYLNLIQVNQVAGAIANITNTGTYWLTNPKPSTLQELLDWISETINVRVVFLPEFKPTPLEAIFQRLSALFQPYLWGSDFKSNLPLCPPISKEFIQATLKTSLKA